MRLRQEIRYLMGEHWMRTVGGILTGSAILAFGLYNVHGVSDITEGGVLGLTLLLKHWAGISPAVTNCVLTVLCYFLGWRTFGRRFLMYSAISVAGFSLTYAICECFPPLYPKIAELPIAAAIIGAVFVGVGVGICVRCGAAPTGDDALAMSLRQRTRIPIQWIYLISDLAVLGLSLSYIPVRRILYSLITVFLSGQIIGWIAGTEDGAQTRETEKTGN